jgi:hypothetical protein
VKRETEEGGIKREEDKILPQDELMKKYRSEALFAQP